MDTKIPRNMVPVSLITPYYRVSGRVGVTSAGLVGLVNDPTDSFIEMENVTLVRIHRPQEVVAQFNVWSVVKARIVAMLLEQNDEWSLNRRYMQLEGLQTVSDTAPTRLPAVAR